MDRTVDQSQDVTERSIFKRGIDPKKKTEVVLCISFNQDKTCIAIGTNYGYKIYNARNFKKIGERDLDMPIAKIQMLYRSNLIMLVKGSPENMRMPDNTLIFWDDRTNDATSTLPLGQNINKIKMRKDLMYIIHDDCIQVFSMETLTIIRKVETKVNPYGKSYLT